MKERGHPIWQLIIQFFSGLVPIALAAIVGALKDVFPSWAFITLMGILSFFLVVALFRIVLGDLFARLWRNWEKSKAKSRKSTLILSWKEHWDSLCDLVNKCIDQPKPPTDKQENEFYELHRWFINNRTLFLPIWRAFERNRTSSNHEHWRDFDPRTKMLKDHWEDPFSVIYQAETLKDAIISLGVLEDGTEHWLNKFQDKSPFKHALRILQERLDELISSG
jgi:hypothetical protein